MATTRSIPKNPTFLCHDLESAAYLWTRGLKFLGIDASPTSSDPNSLVFRFYDPEGLSQNEILAFRKGIAIPAKQYAIALKLLRDQVLRTILA